MDSRIDRDLAERSSKQLGLITRTQARALGLDRRRVAARVQQGRLLRVTDEVLAIAGMPWDRRREVLAACLDAGGVASHRTAAWLHGLHGFGRPARIEVLVRKGRTPRRSPIAREHSTTNLTGEDVVRVEGIPVTSVARTLLDLAKLVLYDEVPRADLVGAVEAAVRDGQASDRWLWWILEVRRCRGRDGVTVMEDVLAERARLGPTESWLERETLRVLDEGGLPRPRVQRRFRRKGRFVSRVDFAYDDCPVVIEVEGATHRARGQASVDARQRDELQLLGQVVLTFTYDMVVQDPAYVVATVRDARALRRAA